MDKTERKSSNKLCQGQLTAARPPYLSVTPSITMRIWERHRCISWLEKKCHVGWDRNLVYSVEQIGKKQNYTIEKGLLFLFGTYSFLSLSTNWPSENSPKPLDKRERDWPKNGRAGWWTNLNKVKFNLISIGGLSPSQLFRRIWSGSLSWMQKPTLSVEDLLVIKGALLCRRWKFGFQVCY